MAKRIKLDVELGIDLTDWALPFYFATIHRGVILQVLFISLDISLPG